MKTCEECFLEICNNIKENKRNINIEYGKSIISCILNYSKIHNYEGIYIHEGCINLEKNIHGYTLKMNYYFSNKKSYISIDDCNTDNLDIINNEYLFTEYMDKLFNKYKIDIFINSLHNKR